MGREIEWWAGDGEWVGRKNGGHWMEDVWVERMMGMGRRSMGG